ncbi:MAG TPA: aminotransferase class I/II-fold pyridoxal phosphate-dependent enzyme [Jatrophihabitans sp.]|uniref:aminotransferase class I/II-fold pyridoxal phosphate-dependent enzyme n=1 Tax=Jatrophihabitans sp. TaxID=1932789 RepID=UPI002F2423B4
MPGGDPPAEPWYRTYFGPSFWALVEQEYTAERTAVEVRYLQKVLEEYAPGRRVLDLGCGTGRHSSGLASHGFQVTGLDVSPSALERAQAQHGGEHGLSFLQHDVMTAQPWPVGEVDAVIFVQGLGWGADADQRRLLRRIHRCLAPGGVLVLDLSNLASILRNFLATGHFPSDRHGSFAIRRDYLPATGRIEGWFEHLPAEGSATSLWQSVRVYLVEQVISLVKQCGFAVEATHAEFDRNQQVTMDSRYVQLVCRAVAVPPDSLALVRSTRAPGPELDLHWTPDEAEFLCPTTQELWRQWWPASVTEQLELVGDYGLHDPYGGHRGAGVLSAAHGVSLDADCITFGAGATQLLAVLSTLADGGRVATAPFGHPDLAEWARASGSDVLVADSWADLDALRACSLIVLDRPGSAGEVLDTDELARLCARLAGTAVVVVDESYANYLGPNASAAPVTAEVDNLVVVRGFSKGYCLGGLRAGYAVCSPALAQEVRARAVPMAVATASLEFALRLIGAGDIFGPLRDRIAEVGPVVRTALQRLGVATSSGHPALPWLVAQDAAVASRVLGRAGISHKSFRPAGGGRADLVRLALPLSEARLQRFLQAVQA